MIVLRRDIPRLAGRVATQPRAAAEPSQLSGTPATPGMDQELPVPQPKLSPQRQGMHPSPLAAPGQEMLGWGPVSSRALSMVRDPPLLGACTEPAWTTQTPAAQRSPSVTPSPGLLRCPLGWVGTGRAVANAAAMQRGSRCLAPWGCTLELCWERREFGKEHHA